MSGSDRGLLLRGKEEIGGDQGGKVDGGTLLPRALGRGCRCCGRNLISRTWRNDSKGR